LLFVVEKNIKYLKDSSSYRPSIMKLFGKAKKAPSAKESIARLKDTIEMLEKREAYLQKKIEREITIAKQNGTKNKKKLLLLL